MWTSGAVFDRFGFVDGDPAKPAEAGIVVADIALNEIEIAETSAATTVAAVMKMAVAVPDRVSTLAD